MPALADGGNTIFSRRRSPKNGAFEVVFRELVRLPWLLDHPHFSRELLLIEEGR